MKDTDEEIFYKIYITTSKLPNAGINGNVFIQLFGKRGFIYVDDSHDKRKNKKIDKRDLWIVKFPLEKSKTNAKKFQTGQTDLFELNEKNVGNIKKIRLTHDAKSSWCLKKIRIEAPKLEKTWKFVCNKWIGPLEKSGKAEIVLYPIKHGNDYDETDNDEDENASNNSDASLSTNKTIKIDKIRYDIRIKTSEFSKSADRVDLKLIGKNVETNKIKLNSTQSDNEKEKFLKDSLDLFKVEECNVETIDKILLYCSNDDQEKLSEWFFDSIIIDVPQKLLRYIFDRKKSKTLIEKDANKNQLVIEIYPLLVEKVQKSKIYKIEILAKLLVNNPENRNDLLNSLTMQIFGDFGSSGELKPIIAKNPHLCCLNSNCKKLNEIIHFRFNKTDLGQIFKLKLKQSKPLKTDWKLIHIRVMNGKMCFNFPYKKWIRKSREKKKSDLKLYEENYKNLRKYFYKENKFSRTISTLSHRLVNEESMNDDSFDEDFESNSDRSRSRESYRNSSRKYHDRSRSRSDESGSRTRNRRRRTRSRSRSQDRYQTRSGSRNENYNKSINQSRSSNNYDRSMSGSDDERYERFERDKKKYEIERFDAKKRQSLKDLNNNLNKYDRYNNDDDTNSRFERRSTSRDRKSRYDYGNGDDDAFIEHKKRQSLRDLNEKYASINSKENDEDYEVLDDRFKTRRSRWDNEPTNKSDKKRVEPFKDRINDELTKTRWNSKHLDFDDDEYDVEDRFRNFKNEKTIIPSSENYYKQQQRSKSPPLNRNRQAAYSGYNKEFKDYQQSIHQNDDVLDDKSYLKRMNISKRKNSLENIAEEFDKPLRRGASAAYGDFYERRRP